MLKQPKFDVLDSAFWIWFCQERNKGITLPGPIIKVKVAILHKKQERNFSTNEGWLYWWKCCHGIYQVVISGEKLLADVDPAKDTMKKFEAFIKDNNMNPDQVYNIDKLLLNQNMLQRKTHVTKIENVSRTKLTKDRLIMATCSNASGNHKMTLFVIGKSQKLIAFKHGIISCLLLT